MAQLQFRSDDTIKWLEGFGTGADGNGSINTSTDAPIDSACTATAGTTSISATNASFATGQLIMVHKTRGSTTTVVGTWELNKIASYTSGTITTTYALQNAYQNSGADCSQVLVMKQYNDLTINNAQTLTPKAWNATVGGIIAYFVKGTATVTGNIDVSGTTGVTAAGTTFNTASTSGGGFIGGYGQQTGGAFQAIQGESTTGAGAAATAANGIGGGGGGGSASGSCGGGGGGHAGAGTDGTSAENTDGVGGGTGGVAALTTMVFGGAGGGAGSRDGVTQTVGAGASSGGIVLLIAKAITITGTIKSLGKGGGDGTRFADGGSSAGGSVLIKAQTAVLGTALITATGGAAIGNGGAGGVGRIHLDYKTSVTGTTNPALDSTQDATLNEPSSGWIPFFI